MDEEKKEDDQIEQRDSVKQSLKQGMYYIIIAVISFISVVFLPMLGSTLGLGWKLPDTTAGWVVWGASRAIVATINVLLFHSFMEQAKLNIKDDEHYKEARDILVKVKKKEHKPKSPAQWNAAQYGKKGVSLFLASAMSVVAIGQAVLSYDWPTALAYLFTLGMGIIFGIMQMKKALLDYRISRICSYEETYGRGTTNRRGRREICGTDRNTGANPCVCYRTN